MTWRRVGERFVCEVEEEEVYDGSMAEGRRRKQWREIMNGRWRSLMREGKMIDEYETRGSVRKYGRDVTGKIKRMVM